MGVGVGVGVGVGGVLSFLYMHRPCGRAVCGLHVPRHVDPAAAAPCAGMSSPDVFHANMIAREMVLGMGMGRRMGPFDLMHVVQQQQSVSRGGATGVFSGGVGGKEGRG